MRSPSPAAAAPEELDMSVLDELPADLREEILREYRQRTAQPPAVSAEALLPAARAPSVPEAPDSPVQATPSRWDAAVLDELPPELVAELHQQYRQARTALADAAAAPRVAAPPKTADDDPIDALPSQSRVCLMDEK